MQLNKINHSRSKITSSGVLGKSAVSASFLLLLFLLSMVATFSFLYGSRDAENYRNYFDRVTDLNRLDLDWIEPSFQIYWFLAKQIDTSFELSIFLLISSALIAKLSIIKNNVRIPEAAIAIYLGWYFFLHDMTQLRISVAAVFLLLALVDYSKGRTYKAVFLTFLGSTLHYSLMAFILLFFIYELSKYIRNRMTPIIVILLLSVTIVIADLILNHVDLPKSYITTKFNHYRMAQNEVHLFSVKGIFLSLLLLQVMISWRLLSLSKLEKLSALSILMGFCVYFGFSDFAVVAVRFSELFTLPVVFFTDAVVRSYRERSLAYILILAMSFLFSFYYIFVNKIIQFT